MTGRVFFSIFAFVLLLNPGRAMAGPLSLDAYLSEVKQANPNVEAAKRRAEALEHRVGPVSTLDDPFFAFGVDEVPFGGGGGSMYRFQISQALPFPGKLGARGKAAEKRAQAARDDADTTERSLIVLATQIYYRTYFNHRALELNDQSKNLIDQSITSAKSRYRTGSDTHHEWILARVELGVLQAERLRLQREQKSLHALLNELRAKSPAMPFEIAEIQFRDEKTALRESKDLLSAQPELKAAQSQSDAAVADERNARLSYFPDFIFQGMAMKPRMSEMGEKGNWGLMVGVNVPLFFWRKQAELVQAARAERNAAEAQKRSIEYRLSSEIVDASEQLKTARDVVALYQNDVIPLTVIAGKTARSGYAARRLPLSQLLETLRVERVQNLELVAAQIDVELSKVRLENLLSSPPVLKLAPSRPTVFGSGPMNSGMSEGTSGTVNMGSGISGPTRKETSSAAGTSSGMGTM